MTAIASVCSGGVKVSEVAVPPLAGVTATGEPEPHPRPVNAPATGASTTVPLVSPVPVMSTEGPPTTAALWVERSVTATGTR